MYQTCIISILGDEKQFVQPRSMAERTDGYHVTRTCCHCFLRPKGIGACGAPMALAVFSAVSRLMAAAVGPSMGGESPAGTAVDAILFLVLHFLVLASLCPRLRHTFCLLATPASQSTPGVPAYESYNIAHLTSAASWLCDPPHRCCLLFLAVFASF